MCSRGESDWLSIKVLLVVHLGSVTGGLWSGAWGKDQVFHIYSVNTSQPTESGPLVHATTTNLYHIPCPLHVGLLYDVENVGELEDRQLSWGHWFCQHFWDHFWLWVKRNAWGTGMKLGWSGGSRGWRFSSTEDGWGLQHCQIRAPTAWQLLGVHKQRKAGVGAWVLSVNAFWLGGSVYYQGREATLFNFVLLIQQYVN